MCELMNRYKATALLIAELDQPVVTLYQLGLLVHKLYRDKQFKGEALDRLKKPSAEREDLNAIVNRLQEEGILSGYKGLPSKSVFSLLGRTHESPLDIVCTIDPFGYISHLSAMEYHGLTDRIPSKIILSSPAQADWRKFANTRMEKDLGDDLQAYIDNGMPKLQRIKASKLGKQEIHAFNSLHLGAYRTVRGRMLRVSTIGRTFLDMLRNAELCGGINHVIDVFEEFSQQHLNLVVEEINQHGKPIDKIRAGYILDELMGLKDPRIEEWAQYAQRGGSRKLDALAEYEPVWSEKWCLSLNVFRKETSHAT